MKDFLHREIHIGDFCVYIKNERTGSSTVRKILKYGNVHSFTKQKVILFPDNEKIFPSEVVVMPTGGIFNEVFSCQSEDSVIVLRFKCGVHDLNFVKSVCDSINNSFPYHKIICLPDDFGLEQMREKDLIRIREKFDSILGGNA